MNKKILIPFLIAGVFLLNACQKNTDIFVPDSGQINGPDTTWQTTITASMPVSDLKNKLLIESHYDSIEVNSNVASVLTPFGIMVNFPPNCCVGAAGQPITGRVQVEIMLLRKKGDMIRMGRPTTSADSLLVTAGEIFVRLKKDGLAVQLAPNAKINIRYTDFPTNQMMKLFMGDESNAQQFNWLPNTDLVNNFINTGTQNYEIYTNHLRWLNVAYSYNLAGSGTVKVAAELAPYFTNTNTIAFTVFKDFKSVVGMYGSVNTKKFSSVKLPVGKAITVVVISKQGNDYFLGFESTVTLAPTTGTGVQSVPVTPIKKSLQDILNYLNTL